MPFQKGHDPNRATGGPRTGAGRKPNSVKALAEAVNNGDDVEKNLAEIKRMAYDPGVDEKVRLAALIYLVDRKLGKPKEPKEHSGGINVTVRILGSKQHT